MIDLLQRLACAGWHVPLHAVWQLWWLIYAGAISVAWAQPAPGVDTRVFAQRLFRVPPVVNLELSQAQAELKKAGFESQGFALDRLGGRRIVASSDPEAGATFNLNNRPLVQLRHRSAGPPVDDVQPQRMPGLIGMTCDEAQRRLMALRLRLAACDTGARSGSVAPGRINRQEPQAGSALNANTLPRVWTEPDFVVVPQLLRLGAAEALARLRQAGLRAEVAEGVVDNWHTVQTQQPRAETRVAPGSAVRLTLVARYVVPDLTGRSCNEAQSLLRNAGLGVLQCQVEAGAGDPPSGRIHRQMPAPQTVLATVQPVQAWEQPQRIAVPDVLGRPEAAAGTLIAQRNLRVRQSGPVASAGRLVSAQAPSAGTLVLPGSEVHLTLDLTVPSVNGLDCEGARARARAHGFDTLNCERKRAGAAQPLHRVFEQAPPAGTRLASAQPLQVQVAMPVTVPAVSGQNLAQALATLGEATLRGEPDARDGDREVTAQKPAAGAEVAPGTAVKLATQRYERVPDVIGLSLPEAQARVSKAGFKASADSSDRAASRKVERQAPAAGERTALGRTVQLFTHVEVTVPDVVKQRLPEAGATLAQSGLRAKPDRDDHAAEREVRAQRPAGGASVAEQSEVALDTRRRVTVPAVTGTSCRAAGERAGGAGLRVESCQVKSLLPLTLGEPVVSAQSLAANAVVDEGAAMTLQAEPPWWSAPVLLSAALSLGAGLARRFWPQGKSPPPPSPPPPAAALVWRVAPDHKPAVSLRLKHDEDAGGDATTPPLAWRVVPGEPVIHLRSPEILEGDSHADRDQRA